MPIGAAGTVDRMNIRITGDSGPFRREVGRAKRAASGFGRAARGAMKVAAAGTAAAAAGAGLAAKEYAGFEEGMSEVGTLVGGTEEAMNQFGEEVRGVTNDLAVSGGTAETTGALYQVLSSNVAEGEEALDVLETSVKSARVGLSDTSTAVNAITSAINAFRFEADQADQVADKFQKTIELGKTTMAELGQQFGDVSGIAPDLGVSLEGVLGSVSALTVQGVQTDKAMTALKSTMTQFLRPSKSLSNRLEELGFESGKAAIEQEGLLGALEELTKGMSEADVAAQFPNVRALQAVLPAVSGAASRFEDNVSEIEAASGNVEEGFDDMSRTASFRFQQMQNEIKDVGIELGGPVIDNVTAAGEGFSDAFGPDTQGLVESTAGFLEDNVTASEDVGRALGEAATGASTFIGSLTGEGQSPADVINTFTTELDSINWTERGREAGDMASEMANSLVDEIDAIDWSTAGSIASSFATGLGGALEEFLDDTDWKSFGESIGQGVRDFLEGVDWSDVGQALWDATESAAKGTIEAGGGFLSGLMSDEQSRGFENLLNDTQSSLERIDRRAASISPFRDVETGHPGARGAIVNRPTRALIGESGPEAVVPLDRSRGNSPLPENLGGTTVQGPVIGTVNVSVDGEADARRVASQLGKQIRRELDQ